MFLKILLAFLALNLLVFLFVPPFIVYRVILVRTKKSKWGRECSEKSNSEQLAMFNDGVAWIEEHKDQMNDVEVESDGFRLRGLYFDFHQDKAVIIIPGRSESCLYSCYYAEPYRKAGFNVLTIDIRAHGESEGKYDNVGYKEYRDVLQWASFLHDRKGISSILLHGICVGCASSLYACLTPGAPDYIRGIVADGMFPTFRSSFDNHLIQQHRLRFPTLQIVMALLSLHSGANAFKDGPITRISSYRRPILFLHSREDQFSLPEDAEKLYALCPSEQKEIVWFDKGVHSHVRYNNKEKYDEAVTRFVERLF